jgi:uncharacterized repeat protein (TIGR02543 family)
MTDRGGCLRWAVAIVAIGLGYGVVGQAQSVTAIAEVNDSLWFADRASSYGGLNATRSYAPAAVFFEGWKSSPRESIVYYEWDFGDGSPVFDGFNAAHIYETPGNYTATLTVTDADGIQSTDTVDVEVLARDGATYYVDAVSGNDSNSGLSQAQAWRTATHAFRGMNEGRYGQGDQILFRRGQTFQMVSGQVQPGHYAAGHGYAFGAFGTGDRPLIQHVGSTQSWFINQTGIGLAHVTFMDLHFDLTTSGGHVGSFFQIVGDGAQLLFYRLKIENFFQALLANGNPGQEASGFFIAECEGFNSKQVHMFARTSRFALLDSTFDTSENHIAYLSYIDRGVITRNTLSRPAFGRTALRIAARTDSFDIPSNNVVVSDNFFRGWIDPVVGGPAHSDGTRYNWELVNLAPNGPWEQRMTDVVFERNTLTNAETFLTISDYDNLIVRNNLFVGKSTYPSPRIKIGKDYWDTKPLRNIKLYNNTIMCYGISGGANQIFGIYNYIAEPYQGLTQHQDIQIRNNVVYVPQGRSRMIYFNENDPGLLNAVTSDNNHFYAPNNPDALFQIGGTFNAPQNLLDLAGWQALTQKDLGSSTGDPMFVDTVGPDGVFANDDIDEDFRPQSDSPLIDVALPLQEVFNDHDASLRPIGAGPEIGAFEQSIGLIILTDGMGSVLASPDPPYTDGQFVTLEAVPNPRWQFVNWSGELISSNSIEQIEIDGAKTVVAHFEQVEFLIDVETFGQGSVAASPTSPYALNDEVTLTATPDAGQQFLGWSGDVTGMDLDVQITVDADKSVLATFTKDEYFLSVGVDGAGTVSASPDPPYIYNQLVTLTAVPGPDMVFFAWEGGVESQTNPLPLNMDTDYNITAKFVQTEYEVMATASGDGQVAVSPSGPFQYLDTVTVTATPSNGFEFVGWSGTQTSDENPLVFDIEADQSLEATFIPIMYEINVGIQGKGSVELVPSGPYSEGQEVTMTAVPDVGWAFSAWNGDVAGTTNPVQFVINSNMAVTAEFVASADDLRVWTSPGGTVQQSPPPPYQRGQQVELTANAAPGYVFLGWSGDNTTKSKNISMTVVGDVLVGAHFGRDVYQPKEVRVPFFLDNDGVTTPDNEGMRTMISVFSSAANTTKMSVLYRDSAGVDQTPDPNSFDAGSHWSLSWRPAASEIGFETTGLIVPDIGGGATAGSARILAEEGGLTGFATTYVNGWYSAQSSYMLPFGDGAMSLSVPFFLDNDGVDVPVDNGFRSFVGIQNTSDEEVTLTIKYRDAAGVDQTPPNNFVNVGPQGTVAWRPFAQEPAFEGPGIEVPDMLSNSAAGNIFIQSTGPIVGRLISMSFGPESQSAYLLPDGVGTNTLFVPFVLDNDGVTTPKDEGVRTFVGVQNLTDRQVTLILNYTDALGNDATPAVNTYTLGPFASAAWRPFAHEPEIEGSNAAVPDADSDHPAGGVRIFVNGGRVVGRVLTMVGGFQGSQSAYLIPTTFDSQTLVVPHFTDNAGSGIAEASAKKTFIGIMNVTPTEQEVTLNYYSTFGQDRTPAENSFTLGPYEVRAWRPAADDPATEGALGAMVPNMTTGTTGSLRIFSPRAGIVGRVVEVKGEGLHGPQSAYQIPPEYPLEPVQ